MWNYSFRLLHDMAARIELAGGEDAVRRDARPVLRVRRSRRSSSSREPPFGDELAAGYALNRFEGLNNEPDMEVPWAYHYAGRPDRTAEVVHAIVNGAFGTGRGGLPGNDDSGGLSSWYVWASLGLFPVAGQGIFFVNAPSFDRSRIRVAGGDFVIEADGPRRARARRPAAVRAVGDARRRAARAHVDHRAASCTARGHLVVDARARAVGVGHRRPPAVRLVPTRAASTAEHDTRPVHDARSDRRRPADS